MRELNVNEIKEVIKMDIQLEKKKGLRPKHYGYIALGLLLLFVGWKLLFSSSVSAFPVCM